MKLTELEPHWFGPRLDVNRSSYSFPEPKFVIGVSFLCPHCRSTRLGIQFEPAIDPENILPTFVVDPWNRERYIWKRTGETFDDLSLSPSINAEKVGHWHGLIVNGNCQ